MMNKTEQAYVNNLERELREAKALRFTDEIEPDLSIPKIGAMTTGFVFNSYNKRISHACSGPVSHGISDDPITNTTSQQGIRMYSTRLLALKAMRAALEREYAKELASIDAQIEPLKDSTT